jgi:hypothetical protein
MKIGDFVHGGYYAGDHDGHHIICSPIEYELPFRVNWHQATKYCKKLGMALPSKPESTLLYNLSKTNQDIIPDRGCVWYWTSTDCSSIGVFDVSFHTGLQGKVRKTSRLYTRPIIRIKIES